MTKPFEFKALVDKLKEKGIDQAEEVAKLLADCVIDWTVESCALHENAIVKVLGAVATAAKPAIMVELDKIDKKVG